MGDTCETLTTFPTKHVALQWAIEGLASHAQLLTHHSFIQAIWALTERETPLRWKERPVFDDPATCPTFSMFMDTALASIRGMAFLVAVTLCLCHRNE